MRAISFASAAPVEVARPPGVPSGSMVKAPAPAAGSGHSSTIGHAELQRHGAGGRVDAALDQQRFGLQIVQVELEFLGAVHRVERRPWSRPRRW
jgi:hypothetical protein